MYRGCYCRSLPSTIRVGQFLLFEFKGVCVEEGISGFPPFYLQTDHLVLKYLHVHRADVFKPPRSIVKRKKVWDLKMHMTFEVKKHAHNREKLAAILAQQKTDYLWKRCAYIN